MQQSSAEKLENTVPAEKERVAPASQNKQLTKTPEPSLAKAKDSEPPVSITRS